MQLLRALFVVSGLGWLVLALGYAQQWDWATATWPWPDGRLSYLFAASIMAAMGVAAAWVGLTANFASLAAGALNTGVMGGGFAAYLLRKAVQDGDSTLALYGAGCVVAAVASAAAAWWAWRLPVAREPRMPVLLRSAFVGFSALLTAVGLILLFGVTDVMPWPVRDDSAALFGWIFVSDALYFAYAVLRPYWALAVPQLLSFLAYDLVLIVPFLRHLDDVPEGLELNLWLYLAVLVASGVICGWFLIEGWRRGSLVPRAPA